MTDSADHEASNTNDGIANDPDGKHFEILKYALSFAVKKTGIGSDSMYARFRHNFHPVCKKHPDAFKNMSVELTRQVESNFNVEVKQIFEEENIPVLMNELDKLIEKAEGDVQATAWRPSGDPAKDCLAHIMPEKLKHKQKLEKLVTELESINKMLKEAHEKKQKKLLRTKQKVDQTTEKWTQAIHDINKTDLKEIDDYLEKYKKVL